MRNSLYQTVFFIFSIALCGPLKGGKSEASKQSWRNYVCSLGLVHLVDREEMKQEWERRIENRQARRELLEQAEQGQADRKVRHQKQKARRARRSQWKSFSGTVTVATGSDGAATVVVEGDAQAEQNKQEFREPAGAGAVDQTDRQLLAELAFVNDPPEELLYENPYVGEATDDPLAWLDGVVAKAAAEVAQQLATNGKEE